MVGECFYTPYQTYTKYRHDFPDYSVILQEDTLEIFYLNGDDGSYLVESLFLKRFEGSGWMRV
jgi:hypothetical protein